LRRQLVFFCWVAGSATLMVVGALGPWWKILGRISIRGIDGVNDGEFVVAFAIVAAAAFLILRRSLLAAIPTIAGGALGAFVTIDNRRIMDDAESPGVFEIGWGLNLAIVASISLALSGLGWLLTFKKGPGPGTAEHGAKGYVDLERAMK